MKKIKALVLGIALTLAGAAYTVSAHAQSATDGGNGESCCCCCRLVAWIAN